MAEVVVEGVAVPVDATVDSRPDLFGVRGQFRPDGEGGMLSRMMDDKPEYATPQASGVIKGFYNGSRGLPWHVTLSKQLGETPLMEDVGHLLSASEVVEYIGGGEVELVPIQTEAGIVIPGKFAVVRKATGEPLGVVGRKYKTFQELEVAEFGQAVVGTGEARWETGALMRGGAWFFLSMELTGLNITVPGDKSPLGLYLLLKTSHDGSCPATGSLTSVRGVCGNTVKLARTKAISEFTIRHTGNLADKVEQARAALGIALKNAEETKQVATTLALKDIVDAQVHDIFAKAVWPIKASESDEEAERKNMHDDRAYENYLSSDTVDGIRGTAWGALNAVTEYLDHGVKYNSKGAYSPDDVRAESVLIGTAAETKERALRALLTFAKN